MDARQADQTEQRAKQDEAGAALPLRDHLRKVARRHATVRAHDRLVDQLLAALLAEHSDIPQ